MKEKFKEKPDYIRYENDLDIIEVSPIKWELKITEKDSNNEYYNQFETREEALKALKDEVALLKKERKREPTE